MNADASITMPAAVDIRRRIVSPSNEQPRSGQSIRPSGIGWFALEAAAGAGRGGLQTNPDRVSLLAARGRVNASFEAANSLRERSVHRGSPSTEPASGHRHGT